jgi:hypothetical protein
MLGGGIWQADTAGLSENQMVLAKREELATYPEVRPLIKPEAGEPLLLVCALGMKKLGDEPLMKVSQEPCGKDRYGKDTVYQRIAIAQTTQQANYRVLLIPFRMGEALPQVKQLSPETFEVSSNNQRDVLSFARTEKGRTLTQVTRNGKTVLAAESL